MRHKSALLGTVFALIGASAVASARADTVDGAILGQASDVTLLPANGFTQASDGATGQPYYYQYFTDPSSTDWLVLFFDERIPGSTTTTPIFEEFGYRYYQKRKFASLRITNEDPAGGDSLTLSNVGYFLSDTQIPLDSLSETLPPAGYTPAQNMDVTLAPGATTPLPTSSWMGLTGVAGLAILKMRRSRGRLESIFARSLQ
ncbi:MAG TPA: hypothetical protein VG722_08300 [Tepidisphaeraceae bacterium]|nr:hypothetical protein [Tepidisphaeraceae bacterium]